MKRVYENQLNKFFFHDAFILNSNYADGVLTLALKDLIFIKDENGKERMFDLAFMIVKGFNVTDFDYSWSNCITEDGERIYCHYNRVAQTNKQERFLNMLSEIIAETYVCFDDVSKEPYGYTFDICTTKSKSLKCTFTCDSVSIEWWEE